MFFLFNTVVVRTQANPTLPSKVEALLRMSPTLVLSAARELYAVNPRLEHEPETARWLCSLLQLKFPSASAVRLQAWDGGCKADLASLPLEELIRLWKAQSSGVNIAPEAHAIWLGCRVVA
jgi:hypothetical protein